LADRIEFTPKAESQLAELPRKHQGQILKKIESLKDNPRPPRSRQLENYSHLHRIDSGNYRIIYTIQDDVVLVTLVKIGHRKDVYRRLEHL
jgi:mRNA interferase RelE/StbE